MDKWVYTNDNDEGYKACKINIDAKKTRVCLMLSLTTKARSMSKVKLQKQISFVCILPKKFDFLLFFFFNFQTHELKFVFKFSDNFYIIIC